MTSELRFRSISIEQIDIFCLNFVCTTSFIRSSLGLLHVPVISSVVVVVVVVVVHTFQPSSSLKPLGQSNSNFMWSILRKGEYEPPHEKINNLHMRNQSRLCFCYTVQFLHYLNPKFQVSSQLLCLYSLVCVGPVRNPHCWFSHKTAHLFHVYKHSQRNKHFTAICQ